ncbi:FAD-dependent monooxygenase OpS4 [Lasiodiplodia hormozganensis]|uniref:FAD-dependent monooxygenase OpS4 n=1 Tax=Lasiodiplodia hormozganensis TaxID=869390 RepID=A0AA40CGY8_9PEZI|nr:FAD-dependent monooxygenase OpS4 [Lasiodiplodia hormozganensis]
MDANKELRVAIVGSGMGGLTCALALARKGFKHISVYEIATNLGFVGAGIQLAPNMARILDRLGVWKDIEAEAVDLKETSIRQGSTDGELAHVDLNYIRDTYGYPHMVGHRASLAGSLYEGCKREKAITFHFGTVVKEVLSWGPKPRLAAQKRSSSKEGEGQDGGETFEITADLVLAADGVKSVIRDQMLRELRIDASIVDTGQAAYRIMLTRDEMKHDPELLALIDKSAVTRWIGEKRHIIAYPVSSKNIYNLSTVQPDKNFADAPSITYTTKGSKAEMLRVFGDFCPMIVRMLDLVPEGEVCEWKLRVHAPIPTWVHGSVALVGDACHPTLPHLAQGAAQAIEDAAVLGEVLARMPGQDPDTINRTLQVYQKLRKERAETLVELAAASGRALHLGEGAAKEERDKQFAALKEKKGGAVPDKWADADVQKKIYGHDCMEVAAEEYEGLLRGVVAQNGVAAAAA